MTTQQILQALDLYEASLTRYGAKAVRADTSSRARPDDPPGQQEHANHLLWMCEETRKFLARGEDWSHPTQGNVEKAMRWLGFIQGGLWAGGIYSIEDMKNHNR